MDEEQCGMYDPDEDEDFEEQREVPDGELTESQKESQYLFL